MKKIFVIMLISIFFRNEISEAQCTAPNVAIGSANIYPTSATVAVFCTGAGGCQNSTLYLEYGLAGFIPGTGAGAGAGGTVMSAPDSNVAVQFNVTGLSPVTAYQVYARRNCSGVFSLNSTVYNFITAYNCANGAVISCNTFVTAALPSGQGSWVTCNNGGPDVIYSFTPAINGNHKLFIKKLPTTGCNFSYKVASSGCNSLNWNCIGYGSAGSIQQYEFGPLTAGTQYYIKVQQNNNVALNVEFRVECPDCANILSNIMVSHITPYQTTISWTGGPAWMEFGPSNFVPGTGNQPGSGGGALYFGSSGTVPLYNLTPNTPYNFYLRSYCNSQTGFNTNKMNFITAACPAVQTYGALGSFSYALPNSVGMFDYPGNSCNFYFVPGNETYYLFTPPATSKYQVTVNYNFQFGGYVFYYNPAGGTCDPTNYLCPVITSGFPPTGTVTYEIGPLTGGTGYYLFFDFSDTVYDFNDVAQFKVDCITPQATATPSGATSICSGNQVTLSAPGGTGNSYLWSNGKTTQSITTGTAGNYAMTITNTCGTSTSAPVTVTVNQKPSPVVLANGPLTFCSGNTVTLSTNSNTGATYVWKKNNNPIPGATSSTYIASTAGNYKVTKTNSKGCTGTSSASIITVKATPSPSITARGPTTFCAGDSVVLKANYNSSYVYQWKKNNANISGAVTNKINVKTSGSYKIKETASNGCTAISSVIQVAVPCRATDEASDEEISLEINAYPNPSHGEIQFQIQNKENENYSLEIFDITGRLVIKRNGNGSEIIILGNNIQQGVYVALIQCGAWKKWLKVVKN